MRIIILFFTTFTLSLSPIFNSALSLNVYAGEWEEQLKKISDECNKMTDEERREECNDNTDTEVGEVGLGEDIDYSKVGIIEHTTGDHLEDEVFMLFITNLIALLSNLIFVVFLGGYSVPSSYFVMVSGGWFVVTYFSIMGEAKQVLEKNIQDMRGTAAGDLKFKFTGDKSTDIESYELLKTQSDHLKIASEMLADLENSQNWSVRFMFLAFLMALVEAVICSSANVVWCMAYDSKEENNRHYVFNKLIKLISGNINETHAYETSGKSSQENFSHWYHLVHSLLSNLLLKIGEKTLMQFATEKKAKDVAGKRAFFLRPAFYLADMLSLESQGDMIRIEKGAFKERAKLVDQLIEKLKPVFAKNSGGGISADSLDNNGPDLDTQTHNLTHDNSQEEVTTEVKEENENIADEFAKTYPKLTQDQMDYFSSMAGEDLSAPLTMSQENFPNPKMGVNEEESGQYAKKAKALDKMLVAKAKEKGIILPPLEDRIKAASEERRKMAENFLKDQSPKALAGLKNLSMFSKEKMKEKKEKLQGIQEKPFMNIPDIEIPEMNLGNVKVEALGPEELEEAKEEKLDFPDFDSVKKKELGKYKLNNMDIYNNKNADIFKVITSRYIKSAYKHFFEKEKPKK